MLLGIHKTDFEVIFVMDFFDIATFELLFEPKKKKKYNTVRFKINNRIE